MLIGVGVLALIGGGVGVVSIVLLVFGVGLLVVSLFDFPMSTTLAEDCLRRRTPLRTQRIEWDEITAINRARGGRVSKRIGPLAAAVGRRRYLLVDRAESAMEYGQLQALLTEVAVPFTAVTPNAETAPTWLYHEKRRPV